MTKYLLENKILYAIYTLCFFYLINQPAIYTPDTSSYMRASIWRSAGYPTFLYVFTIFKPYFNVSVIGFQLFASFTAIHLFTNKIKELLSFPIVLKYLVVLLLIYPLFSPLYVANNICSEGLAYPTYLLVLYFGLHYIFSNQHFWPLFLSTTLLMLTRGQFGILPIILAVVYICKQRQTLNHRLKILSSVILVTSIFFASFINKSFHKITQELYISTPFLFINSSAAALYTSNIQDIENITNEDHKAIFKDCHTHILKNDWILNLEKRNGFKTHYSHFHKYLPKICNSTIHNRATAYYTNKGYKYVEARAKSEEFAKAIFPVLVKNNLSNYLKLYYANLVHGFFKCELLLWCIVALFFFSAFKVLKTSKNEYIILFLFVSLILSNALITSFACHSISRYLFYNYHLLLITIFVFFKLIISARKHRIINRNAMLK